LLDIILFASSCFFLAGIFFLTGLNSAFRRMTKKESKKILHSLGKTFFYGTFHEVFFPEDEYEGIFFASVCAQSLTRYLYAAASLAFLVSMLFFDNIPSPNLLLTESSSWLWLFVGIFGFSFVSFVVGDFFSRVLGARKPSTAMRICAPAASFYLLLAFPITYLFLRFAKPASYMLYLDHLHEPVTKAKQEIIDIIQKADMSAAADKHEKKIIESVLSFRERIAREVMVPRVDVFSLSADTKIREAAHFLQKEGYSRTPVYQNSVDNVVGVLMYKDILNKYMEYEEKGNDNSILDQPISSVQKSILYTPETKKISNLLQEFRKKQVHQAIVVDEYGGTEGIVTIEDILEEIVGEISDEYDQDKDLFIPQGVGSWIVDARMGIFEAEEQFEIHIPQEGEYDTIGGYIFHVAGSIPSKGFIIHQEDFDMEILRSNERYVEKVRLTRMHHESSDSKNSHSAYET